MRLSQLEKISQTSFSMLKAKLQQQTKRKRSEQRNTIKINRRKLPSDFFKGSVEKSLTKKSPIDPQFDRFSIQKTLFLLQEPQTQRKIQSYQCLPSSDPTQINDFEYGKSSDIRTRDQTKNILHRKFLEKQVNDIKEKIKTSRFDKSIDCVKLKNLRQKRTGQKIENFQTKNKKSRFKPTNGIKDKNAAIQIQEFIDMGCTFGRGFKNKIDFSLQNSVMLKQNKQNESQLVEEQISENRSFGLSDFCDKKEGNDKNTEQSETFESSKSKQNSPIRQKNRKRILKLRGEKNHCDELPKSVSAHKSIINKDSCFFNDLPSQTSKNIFTAEEKQRRVRNRINSSSTDQRSVKIRKDKKIQDLNLPKIGKVVSFRLQVKD